MRDLPYTLFFIITLAFLTWIGCQAYQFVETKIVQAMEVTK